MRVTTRFAITSSETPLRMVGYHHLTATRCNQLARNSKAVKFEFLYRCEHGEEVNNGLKDKCVFEFVFEEGPHHCPICGHKLTRISSGPTVSEILRKGEQEAAR